MRAGSHVIHRSDAPEIQFLRSLDTREGRERTGLFVAEGVRMLAHAVQQQACIEQLIVAPEMLNSGIGARLVKRLRIAGTPCMRLTPAVFHSFSQAEEPQGVAAVIRQQWHGLESVRPDEGLCWVAVDSIRTGGNLGTIIRTAEAVGAAGIVLLGSSIDPYNSATVRATMGALFSLRYVRASIGEFRDWKLRMGCKLVGAAVDGSCDYRQARYPPGSVLVMGCERKGISAELAHECDLLVRIPMVGSVDSLNLGVAAGVMLYEMFHQRRFCQALK